MSFESNYTKFRQWSYQWRAKYFQPILKLLAKLKITPNQITTFRLIFVLPIAYYFYLNNLFGVLVFYLIFWILDLFDGSLARFLNVTKDKGGFLDSLVDHFISSVIILGFIYLQAANPLILAYYILIQLFVNLLANIKRWENEESNWLIKVKPNVPYFKIIANIFLFLYFLGLDFLNPGFLILNIWMTSACLYYFFIIKNRD
ncbi:MAG: CDP-alcohol phosphatidyltransferase family protein [Candidatus Parcubacteria bacterium]|nr:CDP-alcohol phosphatidyltransferase family protein [Candidatus Parcubacteria bacterium]